MNLAGTFATIDAVLLVVVGQTLLKWGMIRVGPINRVRLRSPLTLISDIASRWQIWAGLAVYVVSAAVWVFALARVPLSFAAPMLALTYVGVPVASISVFDESLTPAQWLGIAIAAVGVMVVALAA
jgi:drug/metabolite transporter (DMT)-like permease